MQQVKEFSCAVANMDAEIKTYQWLVPPIKEKYFGDTELGYFGERYQVLYPTASTDISRLYKECKKITINQMDINKNLITEIMCNCCKVAWCGRH